VNFAPFIPAWITLPLAAASMLTVAAHLLVVERTSPRSVRRRIRLSNGWIMLIAIPLIAAGFSFIDPDAKPRMFLIVWSTIIGLVSISIALALADVVNTFFHARQSLAKLRQTKEDLARLTTPPSQDSLERADEP